MKKIGILQLLACGLLLGACSSESGKPDSSEKKKESDTSDALNKNDVSYALGYNVGDVLHKTDPELSLDDLIKGMKDAYNKNSSPRLDESEIKKLLMLYNFEISKAMKEKQETLKIENVKKGTAFATDYAKKQGVKKHDSGLYYKVLKKGEGRIPKKEDVVLVDYTGKKLDGSAFFSTKEQGQPAQFTVANVIKGWMIALQEMPEGSQWEIVVPPDLA